MTLAAVLTGLAVLLWPPRRPRRLPVPQPGLADGARTPVPARGWSPGRRLVVAVLAGCGVWLFLPGPLAAPAAVPAGVAAWVALGRVEPADVRREREAVRRELPHAVSLLASTLQGGAAPEGGLRLVAQALPGPAADRLLRLASRLALGADPGQAWAELGASAPELAGLGRSMSRAHRSGAPVAAAVERVGQELARTARAEVEDRARAVGVKAALPLGLCLLPSFILIGIVPLVAGLMATVV